MYGERLNDFLHGRPRVYLLDGPLAPLGEQEVAVFYGSPAWVSYSVLRIFW